MRCRRQEEVWQFLRRDALLGPFVDFLATTRLSLALTAVEAALQLEARD